MNSKDKQTDPEDQSPIDSAADESIEASDATEERLPENDVEDLTADAVEEAALDEIEDAEIVGEVPPEGEEIAEEFEAEIDDATGQVLADDDIDADAAPSDEETYRDDVEAGAEAEEDLASTDSDEPQFDDDRIDAADQDAGAIQEEPATIPEPDHEPAFARAPEQAAPPPPPVPEPKRSGGFVPAFVGGLVAAGVGFGAATFTGISGGGPDPDAGPTPAEQALSAISAQDERLAALETQLSGIADAVAATPDESAVESGFASLAEQLEASFSDRLDSNIANVSNSIGGLSSGLTGLSDSLSGRLDQVGGTLGQVETRLSAVDDRLTVVEKRPLVESSETAKAAFAAYERELDGLRESLADQQAANKEMSDALSAAAAAAQEQMKTIQSQTQEQMQAIEEQAQATTEAAKAEIAGVEEQAKAVADAALAEQAEAQRQAQAAASLKALAELEAALETGEPYGNALSVLSGSAEIPEALGQFSETGIASLENLRTEFPDAAREALDASLKATVDDDTVGKLVAFIRTQTGARSLEAREGDDPDAILSRAEASLKQAQFDATIAELGALPQAGQDAMADWIGRAQARLAALTAATDLAAQIDSE